MTYKALIAALHRDLRSERSRLPKLYYADAKIRTKGRIQGIKRAIQIAKKLRDKRMAT